MRLAFGFRGMLADQDCPCFFISMVCSSGIISVKYFGLPSGARSKIHQIRPLSSFEPFGKVTVTSMVFPFTSCCTRGGEQLTFDVAGKEMLEHEGGFVVLVPLGLRVPSLAVPRVGSEINRNGWVVLPSPSHVEGDHVMGARVEEHVDLALSQRIQVTGNENAIGNFAGEFLEILPGSAGIENPPVEVGSEMPAGKPSVAAPLCPQFLPRLIVIEAERGIPNGRDGGVYGRHPLVVNDRHGGRGSVFRSARHGDFALFKMIFFSA